MPIKLYDIQQREVDKSHYNWIYVMSPGTGKTFTSLAHYQKHSPSTPLVIIAPKAVLEPDNQWKKAINEFFNKKDKPPKIEYFKTDEIKKLPEKYFKNSYVIVDEVHKYKNIEKTQRSDKLRMLLIYSLGFVTLSGTLVTGDIVKQDNNVYIKGGKKQVPGSRRVIPDSRWEDLANYFAIFQCWQYIHNKPSMFDSLGKPPRTWTPVTTKQLAMKIIRSQAQIADAKLKNGRRYKMYGYPEFHKYLSLWFNTISSSIVNLEDITELPPLVKETIYFSKSNDYLKKRPEFNSKTAEVIWERNNQNTKAKLDWVSNFLDNTEQNIIIFYNFKAELEYLKTVIPKTKHIIYRNGSRQDSLMMSNKNNVVLIQVDSGGAGLNIQQAPIAIWYSYPNSYINYEQSKWRNYRAGQTQKTLHYQLHVTNTIDDKMKKSLDSRKDFTV